MALGKKIWLGLGRQQVILVKLLTLKNQKPAKVLKFSVLQADKYMNKPLVVALWLYLDEEGRFYPFLQMWERDWGLNK